MTMRRSEARKRAAPKDKPKNPLNAAVKLLSIRQRSVKELAAKLASRGFDAAEIEKTVSYLIDTRYLDDAKYAAALASTRAAHKHWGPAKIRAELSAKGVAPEIIKMTVRGQFEGAGNSEGDAADSALERWLRKKALSAPLDKTNFTRAVRHLISRGFSTAAAMQALGRSPSRNLEFDGE